MAYIPHSLCDKRYFVCGGCGSRRGRGGGGGLGFLHNRDVPRTARPPIILRKHGADSLPEALGNDIISSIYKLNSKLPVAQHVNIFLNEGITRGYKQVKYNE